MNRSGSNLSGYAWSENAGWIRFDPTGGGVTLDPDTGDFDGYAWGENVGWIHFQNASPAYKVAVQQPPEVTVDPQSTTVCREETATLTVTATGTEPLHYQWYEGLSGDESAPLAGAVQAEIEVGPLSTGFYDFWARVTGGGCAEDSVTAVVEVSTLTGPDLNLDGVVNRRDVKLLADYLAGRIDTFPSGLCVADLNLDGVVDATDLVFLQNFLAGNFKG